MKSLIYTLFALFLLLFTFACQEEEVISSRSFTQSTPVKTYGEPSDQSGLVEYAWVTLPSRPRPLPCPSPIQHCEPGQSLLQIRIPEGGEYVKVEASLETETGEVFACSSEKCKGNVKYEGHEAYATLSVVNPELHTEALFLAIQVSFYLEGQLMTEEIYDPFTFQD